MPCIWGISGRRKRRNLRRWVASLFVCVCVCLYVWRPLPCCGFTSLSVPGVLSCFCMTHMKPSPWHAVDTHEAEPLGHSWQTWSRALGTQLTHMKHSPWDAADTHEAEPLGRKWHTWSRALGTQVTHFLDRRTQLVRPRVDHILRRNCLLKHFIEGKIEVRI